MKLPHRRRPAMRGAAMIEAAIVLPVAVLLVLTTIQVGSLMVAKLMLNHALNEGARRGAVRNAREDAVRSAMVPMLSSLYQDALEDNDNRRIGAAVLRARADLASPMAAVSWLTLERLTPTAESFEDFGRTDRNGRRVLPNDHLQVRSTKAGARSGLTVQQANVLRLRAVFGYELKVPLMKSLLPALMCGSSGGAFGAGAAASFTIGLADAQDCARYYAWGRVPLVSQVAVMMQSDADAVWP